MRRLFELTDEPRVLFQPGLEAIFFNIVTVLLVFSPVLCVAPAVK
jgi:hypothetical protein